MVDTVMPNWTDYASLYESILAARERMRVWMEEQHERCALPVLQCTRITPLEGVNTWTGGGGQFLAKCEQEQPFFNSYKGWGIYSALSALSREQLERGVITASTGNHGMALGFVASRLGIPCTVVMGRNVDDFKLAAVERHLAKIIQCGLTYGEVADFTFSLAEKFGYALIAPGDDPNVIAGYGVFVLETLEQVFQSLRQAPGKISLAVPVGGGALLTAAYIVVKKQWPEIEIIAVRPGGEKGFSGAEAADVGRAWPRTPTVASGLDVSRLDASARPIIERWAESGGLHVVAVSDERIVHSMLLLHGAYKMVVEPAAAAVLAIPLAEHTSRWGSRDEELVIGLLTGGNISIAQQWKLSRRYPAPAGLLGNIYR